MTLNVAHEGEYAKTVVAPGLPAPGLGALIICHRNVLDVPFGV